LTNGRRKKVPMKTMRTGIWALAALVAAALLAPLPARAASMHAEADSADMSGMAAPSSHHARRHRARGYAGYNRPRIFAVTPRGVYYRYSPGIKPQGPGFGVGFSAY
jgi:acetoin utilization deacetylase AcuC-like enzyme